VVLPKIRGNHGATGLESRSAWVSRRGGGPSAARTLMN
jgi:hypothetical protein